MRIPMAQLPFPVYSVAAISLVPLAHALVLTLLAMVPALLMQRRIRAEGVHHHLISASIAGAVTLVAGSCLLPILALHLPAAISPGEFIMPVFDGPARLQIASLILLVCCALATLPAFGPASCHRDPHRCCARWWCRWSCLLPPC